MRQAGFKPATAPTPLVWIASQRNKEINFLPTHRPVQFTPFKCYNFFLDDFDFEKHWNRAIFEHCPPPRKHKLGKKKGIDIHWTAATHKLLTTFRFNLFTHMETISKKRELATSQNNWAEHSGKFQSVYLRLEGGSNPGQPRLISFIIPRGRTKKRSLLYKKNR